MRIFLSTTRAILVKTRGGLARTAFSFATSRFAYRIPTTLKPHLSSSGSTPPSPSASSVRRGGIHDALRRNRFSGYGLVRPCANGTSIPTSRRLNSSRPSHRPPHRAPTAANASPVLQSHFLTMGVGAASTERNACRNSFEDALRTEQVLIDPHYAREFRHPQSAFSE